MINSATIFLFLSSYRNIRESELCDSSKSSAKEIKFSASKYAKSSNSPQRGCGSPEQQEQHTNISVHGEKCSVQLAEIVCSHERMFVAQQSRHHPNPRPRWPRQSETARQPA